MRRYERQITQEQYERARQNFGYITKADEEAVFTDSERYGYGVYGNHVFERDGQYFVSFSLGSTCD